MVQQRDCIHWQVCVRACPRVADECEFFEKKPLPTEGKWLKVEGVKAYQCSNCNTIGDHNKYYCSTCGSKNVLEDDNV